MKITEWKKQPAGLSVSAERIEKDGFAGLAGYVSVLSADPLPGNPSAVFSPVIADTGRYVAIENHTSSWCRPFWGKSLSELPGRTQELIVEEDGNYTVFLPVCDTLCKTVIRGCEGGFEFAVSSNLDGLNEIPRQLSFVVLEGSRPLPLLRAAAEKAAELLGNGLKMRNERIYPPLFDSLGWCSWDALQIRVNEKDLLKKAAEFSDKGVPVGFAIIDDMWADVPALNEIPASASFDEMVDIMHESRLRSFEGDKKRFPDGMKPAVEGLKKAGIKNVGIWFPTFGYWAGLEPGGKAAKELSDCTVTLPDGRIVPSPEEKKAGIYFDRLCQQVKDRGGDFVKIDNQGIHKNYRNLAAYGESAGAIQRAMATAVNRYFDGAVVNCMGMPNECMFHRTETAVCRCSDDFLPDNREWFFKHILQCSFNGLLQGQYQVNDWDMWWTADGQAVKNAVCRAVSGGPVYVSDKIGDTNPEILKPLCLSDGRILRCDESAVPTGDCLFENPTLTDKIFKVINRAGDSGVVAVFNINSENKPVVGSVSPSDSGLPEGDYACYEYFTGSAGILLRGDSVPVTLGNNDSFRLYTFVPMKNGIAVLGRTDKYIGVKAVCELTENSVGLCEGGCVGFVSGEAYRFTNAVTGEPLEPEHSGVLWTVSGKDIRFEKA